MGLVVVELMIWCYVLWYCDEYFEVGVVLVLEWVVDFCLCFEGFCFFGEVDVVEF